MSANLRPSSFVVAGESAVPTRRLRQAAGMAVLQQGLPFIAYVADRHRHTAYGPIAQAFLEREADHFDELVWSPMFRTWLLDIKSIPDWDDITPRYETLLREFCALILRPGQGQDYLTDMPIKLADGGRYSPVALDWCWIADDPNLESVMPASLAAVAEVANGLDEGQSARVKLPEGPGAVRKAVRLKGRTSITNLPPRLKVYLSGTNQRNNGALRHKVDWESYPDDADINVYQRPYELMAEVWPEEFADHLETLRAVVPMVIPKQCEDLGSQAISFTLSSHQGAIFLTSGPQTEMLEMLLHEKAHVKLRYLEEVCPLLEPEQTAEHFPVPWRRDPRPIAGIFEGIYVFLQVAIGLSRCARRGHYEAKKRAAELFNNLEVGINIIGRHARMTAEGQEHYLAVREAYSQAREEFTGSQLTVLA